MNTSNHAAPQTGGVRFAPSPTGRFHVGNLRTAWISHEFARALKLPWVVRFEDIDRPRVVAGALELQLADMKALGLVPDLVLIQSEFEKRHFDLFERARADGAIYPCNCSRKDVQTALAEIASAPHSGVAPVYSGHCRLHSLTDNSQLTSAGVAWRFKMPDETGASDFIVARTSTLKGTDGFTAAYHWACAIDDFDGAYDLIVRSEDLAAALPLQRGIQKWIAASETKARPFIRAYHAALVTQDDGHRLEKRTRGVTLLELLANGRSAPEVISVFEKSFSRSAFAASQFDRDLIAAEQPTRVKLSELFGEGG